MLTVNKSIFRRESDDDLDDEETRAILGAQVGKKSRGHYEDTLVRFFRHMYDHLDEFPGVSKEEFLLRLSSAAKEDSNRRTKSGAPSKRCISFKAEVISTLRAISRE